MDIQTIVILISFVLGLAGQSWLIVKYIIDRMDKKMETERESRERANTDMNARIERIKETHVLREDFHRFVDGMTTQIDKMTTGLNHRMDQLFTVIAQGNSSRSNKRKV